MSSAGLTPPIAYDIRLVGTATPTSTTATPGAAVTVYSAPAPSADVSALNSHPSKVSSTFGIGKFLVHASRSLLRTPTGAAEEPAGWAGWAGSGAVARGAARGGGGRGA